MVYGYFSLPVLKSKDHTGCSRNMTEVCKNAKSYYDFILRNTIALPRFYKRGKNRETWFTKLIFKKEKKKYYKYYIILYKTIILNIKMFYKL